MANTHKEINKLSDIPELDYEGYIWNAHSSSPEIVNTSTDLSKYINDEAYIIEGYLYSAKGNISISIKQIDGKNYISKIDLKGIDLEKLSVDSYTKHSYLSDRAISRKNKDFKYIRFIRFWEKEKYELCAGMDVLQPAWIAFIGFSNEEWI